MQPLNLIIPKLIMVKSLTESPIEVLLFNELMRSPLFVLCPEGTKPTGEGYFVLPQAKIGQYRADFLIKANLYPSGIKVWPPNLSSILCVECDGHEYHSAPEDVQYDKERDEFFKTKGVNTIRFTGSEITRNAKFCVEQIAYRLQSEAN